MEFSWIQRHALLVLVRCRSARVVELCPPDVAANLFAYHLDGLVGAGYIKKISRGLYGLTVRGQKLAGTFSTATDKQADNIKTVVMLYAKTEAGYLLFKWSRQPYLGSVTPLYDRVPFGKSLRDGVRSALYDKLGVDAPIIYKTNVLIEITHHDELISHMNAFVYKVDITDVTLPFQSRNGEAFVGYNEPTMMDGVVGFLEAIDSGVTVFDIEWQVLDR